MSFGIVKAQRLNSVTALCEIEAPVVAKRVEAGQFIVLRIGEKGERIPLTVARKDIGKGAITIIFQEAGKTTKELASLKEGDVISDLIGPLGRPTDFGKVGKIIIIAGGIGTAEILPVIKYAKEQGNDVTVIIGARSKELIILEEELKKECNHLIITTDDGSYGQKGLVTSPLKELLAKESFDLAYCVGPDIMMKAVCEVTKEFGLKTLVSLDANMVDATGMCGTCRVSVGGQTKFTCVDGPEFDGHLVDWDGFLKRQNRFKDEEKRAKELYEETGCKCKKK
jgi:ferredoxin--NADP+ reductase